MQYISTRDKSVRIPAAEAIATGISKESGLFVPESLPVLSEQRLAALVEKTYVERACDILGDFLTDFSPQEIRDSVQAAYGSGKFNAERVAPLVRLSDSAWMLELWHGPTCAFKDMALQLLPHLLTRSVKKSFGDKQTVILVATSGDTGKAALEGFRDVPGTEILVFYPHGGVSEVQKLQMLTQEGENVGVCGVMGNFDDAQTGVKRIFTDPALRERLARQNMMFSSANSINWGRLVPQIVYYVSAYCDMVADSGIKMGDKINICVPTGNFGNILAAYYAKHMGLPVGKLICASNINNVLTDFFETGTYDRRREFVLTSSPSMDILISSNLERLLFALYEEDDTAVADLMRSLSENGTYSVPDHVLRNMQQEFAAGYCDEAATATTIRETFASAGYLADTHTAVAINVHNQYVRKTGDNTKTVIASTANPYKFTAGILRAITGKDSSLSEFDQAAELSRLTKTNIPPQIRTLRDKAVRFSHTCEIGDMWPFVQNSLRL